jgi:hypothetical protein
VSGNTPPDFVDSARQGRACPYCGREQFWSESSDSYCHAHNLNLHCDEERLAGWDLHESWKTTP